MEQLLKSFWDLLKNDLNPQLLDGRHLQNLPPFWFGGLVLAFSFFAIYFLFKTYKNLIKIYSLKNIPIAKVNTAPQGYIKLSGMFKPYQTQAKAFLTQQPCVWYEYRIEYYQAKQWQHLESGQSTAYWLLEDDSDHCLIDPSNAIIYTPIQQVWRGKRRYPKRGPIQFLGLQLNFGGRYRYRERRLVNAMSSYALGNFHTTYPVNAQQAQPQHCLSAKDLDKRQPYIISGYDPKVLLRRTQRQAAINGSVFLIIVAYLGWLTSNWLT
jgi:hypothetical protein